MKQLVTCAALAAIAIAPVAAVAQDAEAARAPVVQAAYDCIEAHVRDVARAEPDVNIAINLVVGYLCQEEIGRASLYEQNRFLVETFGERLVQRLDKTIAVDEETGDLVTDLTVEQASVLGYTDWSLLQNEMSARAQGPLRYYQQSPRYSSHVARRLVALRLEQQAGEAEPTPAAE